MSTQEALQERTREQMDLYQNLDLKSQALEKVSNYKPQTFLCFGGSS